MTTVWIVDIDKTIADYSHRIHYLKKNCVSCGSFVSYDHINGCPSCNCDIFDTPTSSWKAFTDPNLLRLDKPVVKAQEVIFKAANQGIHIHYITGRQNNARTKTQEWLVDHFNFDSNKSRLLMRDVDSYNQDKSKHIRASVHKENKFLQLMEIQGYTFNDTFYAFDDDKHALSMYNKYCITFLAPECWDTMVIKAPNQQEPLFNR